MDFSIKLRAARAALGWTQGQLADAADVSPETLQNIEGGSAPTARTQEKITRALNKNGVILTSDGIQMPDATAIQLTGGNWFLDVLEDAFLVIQGTRNKEILIFGSDHRVSPPAVIEGFRKLLSAGASLREIGEEGNTFIMSDIEQFRWVPSEHYKNTVTMIYGDKVVTDFGTHGMLIKNKEWAESERHKFELIWSNAIPASKSTADVKY